ncbi:MAG TPA: sensor domain-containing diguanylate cyclase [Gaiella sp.]
MRSFGPFALVGLLALLVTLIPPRPDSWTLVVLAALLTVAIAISGVAVPWSQLPRWTYIVPPLAYFVVIALLRHTHSGGASGYVPLAILPVVWIALNLGRREVAIGVAAGLALFVVPLLLGADYGAGEGRRAALWAAVAALVGFAVESLVREKRVQAREARLQAARLADHEQTMSAVAEVARRLTFSGDTRALICEAAVEVGGASIASIFEPEGTGYLVITAGAGADPGRSRIRIGAEPSGAAVAFAEGRRFFVPDAAASSSLSQDVVQATGMVSALFEPIFRDDVTVGVLGVGWPFHLDDLSRPAAQAVVLLAAEAAAAIERADLHMRLEALARTDELTGLPNRRAWEETIREAVADATLRDHALCIALIDLDHFKRFNDRHGHQAGDRLLKSAAASWRSALRGSDTLARYGGEEFAAVLPHCRLGEAHAVLERLRARTPDGLTCSVGLAEWSRGESDLMLVARADEALYEAKRVGRDVLVVSA